MIEIGENKYLANVDDIFTITLEENRTTGYTWELNTSGGLAVVSDKYKPITSGLLGSTGERSWRIRCMIPGLSVVYAMYRRPWEPISGNDDTIVYEIIVK